jgi:hypothetical protein
MVGVLSIWSSVKKERRCNNGTKRFPYAVGGKISKRVGGVGGNVPTHVYL